MKDRRGRRQPPIADYGFVSDCHSAALIDRQGSIDWWCVPRFDSPSVFGRLLDENGGHWSIHPVDALAATERRYLGDTLVLRTAFRTAQGEVALTDAAALQPGARSHDIGLRVPPVLIRRVEGVRGSVAMEVGFAPRVEYGRTQPHLRVGADGVVARGGPVQLGLTSPVTLRQEDGAARGRFFVSAGEVVEFRLTYEPAFGGVPTPSATTCPPR